MELRFSTICDAARSTPDGKLDIQGVYHDLAAPGFPARQDRIVLVIVIEWEREDHGRYLFKADLEDQEGNVSITVEGETEVHLPGPNHPPARSQLIMPLENIVFPKSGQYAFVIRVKGQTLQGPSLYLMETDEEGALP